MLNHLTVPVVIVVSLSFRKCKPARDNRTAGSQEGWLDCLNRFTIDISSARLTQAVVTVRHQRVDLGPWSAAGQGSNIFGQARTKRNHQCYGPFASSMEATKRPIISELTGIDWRLGKRVKFAQSHFCQCGEGAVRVA